MITDTYVFELDFQDEEGFIDISEFVDLQTIVRSGSIYNNLKPTSNTLRFEISRDADLYNQIMTTQNEILIRATKNSDPFFTGYLRRNFKYSVKQLLQPMKMEAIDNTYRLERKCMTNATYIDYNVINTSTPDESIVHAILTLSGFSGDEINVSSIAETIDYFTIEKGKQTYKELLTNLLFEFGYVYYCDWSGDFCIYNWAEDSISTTNKFGATDTERNMIGELESSVKPIEIEGVDVIYWGRYQVTENIVIFNEQQNSTGNANCFIPYEDDGYYPPGIDSTDIYLPYQVNSSELKKADKRGNIAYLDKPGVLLPPRNSIAENFSSHEVVCVPDTIIHSKVTAPMVGVSSDISIINYHTQAKVTLHMTLSGGGIFILRKFQLLGKPIMRGDTQIVMRRLIEDSEKVLSIKTQYITTDADATKLASALERYYRFGVYLYRTTSEDEFDIGDYAYVDEDYNIGINNLIRIIGRQDNEWTGEHVYTLEGVAEYTVEEITTESIREMPSVILPSGVDTVVEKMPQIQFVSVTGETTYDEPGEGDLVRIQEDGVDNYYEYTGGEWTQTTAIAIGKYLSGVFTGLILCLAIVNSNCTLDDSGEWLPSNKFRVLDCENDLEDQYGNLPNYFDNISFSSDIKKFGTYAAYGTSDTLSYIQFGDIGTSGKPQAFCMWIYIENIEDTAIFEGGSGLHAVDLSLDIISGKVRASIQKNALADEILISSTTSITAEEWHLIGFVYDKDNELLHVVLDNEISTISTDDSQSWEPCTMGVLFGIDSQSSGTYKTYVDELLFYQDKYLDPYIIAQHYNHNIPWNIVYAKNDVTLIPGTDGRVFSPGAFISSKGISGPRAIFEHQTASATNGGSSTASSFQKRTVTETYNDIDGCSVSSGVITLSPGKYIFLGWQTLHGSSTMRAESRVRDTTSNISLALASAFSDNPNLIFKSTAYEITVESDFELQYFTDTSKSTDGLGVAVSSGEINVFAHLEVIQVG
jgi:hypothetical protein